MIECTKFKSHVKGHLQGFADFYISKWGVEINGCALYKKEGRRWVNFPTREYENEEGEKKFMPLIRFRNKEHQTAFTKKAKEAIDEWCKEIAHTEEKPCKEIAHTEEVPL